MVINFDEIENMLDKEVIIHCDTEEKAKDLLKNLDNLGFIWRGGDELISKTNYSYYGHDTCYKISNNDNRLQYCSIEFYENEGFDIYEYEITEKEVRGLKIWELVEGVEYRISNVGLKYRVVDGVLEVKSSDGIDCWRTSRSDYNYIMYAEFIECEFNPEFDERYYFPSCEVEQLYKSFYWTNDIIDNNIKRNVGVYRTKEQAVEKAKELGWT